MFDFFLVYPAALFLGLLAGVMLPRWGRKGTLVAVLASGVPGAAFAVVETFAYRDMAGVAQLLTEMAVPAALICYALGLMGGLVGAGIRSLLRRLFRS